jgi:hypothetical protein
MNGIIAAKRTMQQKKREYAWIRRVFVDRTRSLAKNDGEEEEDEEEGEGRRRGMI